MWVAMSEQRRVRIDVVRKLFQRDTAVCWMTCFDPSTNWIRAVSRHERRQDGSSHCLRTVHGLGMVCGPAGPISLSAVFSSLVSPMGTTDVTGWKIGICEVMVSMDR